MNELVSRRLEDRAERQAILDAGVGTVAPDSPMPWIVDFLATGLAREGFRRFHNGGLPLLERRRGPLRDELVFVPVPAALGANLFRVRLHLSHAGVTEVRGRYWRPAIRAPHVIVSADLSELEETSCLRLWDASGLARTGAALLNFCEETLVPYLNVFDHPRRLRRHLERNELPLIDPSTALDLVLAEFGVREARYFYQRHWGKPEPGTLAPEVENFDLSSDRRATVAAYYRL